eukprot:scaffold36627_cov199-Amphora_coffeaeformis.AAC.1
MAVNEGVPSLRAVDALVVAVARDVPLDCAAWPPRRDGVPWPEVGPPAVHKAQSRVWSLLLVLDCYCFYGYWVDVATIRPNHRLVVGCETRAFSVP